MTHSVDAILDATGLNCPEPVMMLHNKVRDLAPGGLLKVIATDPSTRRDIPKFCVFLGHEPGRAAGRGGHLSLLDPQEGRLGLPRTPPSHALQRSFSMSW